MHEGRFPSGYDTGLRRSQHPPLLSGHDLLDEAPAMPRMTRRAWLVGVGGMLCVAAVSATTIWARGDKTASEREPGRKPQPDPPPNPTVGHHAPPAYGSLDWALAMRHASDAELIRESGRLEMVSARHRREAGLVPVFERLLQVALKRDLEHWDMAGACAVRSLARLGRPNSALRHRAQIEDIQAPEMQGAVETVLRRLGRNR